MKIYKTYKNTSKLNKEIYLTKSLLPRNKNNSTYNLKKILKDRKLIFKPTLINIVYYSGFVKSIKEAKHIILNNYIKINNNIVNKPNIKIKSGDIIISTYKNTLLSYYERKFNIIKLNPINKFSNEQIKINYILKNYKKNNININTITSKRCKELIKNNNNILYTCKNKKLINNKLTEKTYKKFKYMIPNKRIHRISYNSII